MGFPAGPKDRTPLGRWLAVGAAGGQTYAHQFTDADGSMYYGVPASDGSSYVNCVSDHARETMPERNRRSR